MASILLQDDDTPSEQGFGEWINFKNERNQFNDDPSVTVDFPNNQVTAGGDGDAYIQSGDKLYKVEPDEQTLALPDSNGQNWLYLTFTPGTDDQVSWEVSNTQGGPSDPKLLRAVIDTSSNSVDDRNLAPETEHNKIDVNDSGTDPSANGEIRRNGSDTKVYTGGSILNFSNVNEGDTISTATIDDTDSPYTTNGEDIIYVDESGGAVTVTLATSDATNGNAIEIVSLTGTNTVTVDTEGSESIDPDGDSSKAIDAVGWGVAFVSNGTNWAASLAGEFERLNTADLAGASTDDILAVGASPPDLSTTDSPTFSEVTNSNYEEPQVTASEGTSYDIDVTSGNYHKVTLTGDVTFDITNADGTNVNSIVLHLVQDGTGGRSPSFTPTVVWDSGSAPSWSTGANEEDLITLIHDQDGSQWIGLVGGLTLG